MKELPKTYDPAAVEAPTYERWVRSGYFTADATSDRPRFCMVLPPPNVTGSLHVGHALDHSIPDLLARWHRMRGDEVLWLPGTDHAGIATQNAVERELAKEGRTRFDLGRDAFVERVWQWRDQYGGEILGQMRRLGDSVDWTRERFTMDEGLSRAVREVFVRLYEEGLLYRAERIINWCPRCGTALSDIEVEHEEVPGELAYLRYPLSDASGEIVVATSRAETMLGDTAVAVHPGDSRYADFVGKTVRLPLVDRDIPVVADEAVDPDFGTGAVKVTPAHDPDDWAIAQRHGLPAIDIFDDEAIVNDAGGRFAGMDRYAAREAVKQAFAELGLLEKVIEAPHSVGHCQRCGTEVEPRLSLQWFVATASLAETAMQAVRTGETRFVPENYARTFFDWMENIRDWCVSRQLWWGHRIPAWYCPNGHVMVERTDPTSCSHCGSAELERDPDVLDTWFSSGLWPMSTLGWPEETEDLAAFYPTSVLVTGYDIIFFWVARMLMFACHFRPPVPFYTVAIHGMVRDGRGKKMSKSSGNVIDPLDFMDRYGTDALRFALLRGANPGANVPLAEEWVAGGRNFANKIWNIARFILQSSPEGVGPDDIEQKLVRRLADRWLLSRLHQTITDVTLAYEELDPAEAARLLYAFGWGELADWGVELAKPRLSAGGDDARSAAGVLLLALDALLRLLHPMMPFVTEELGRVVSSVETITLGPWPEPRADDVDPDAERDMERLQAMVTELRRFRADHGVRPEQRPSVTIVTTDPALTALVDAERTSIERLGRVGAVSVAAAPPDGEPGAKLLAAGAELHVPLAGLVDVAAERARLAKRVAELEGELERAEAKLANANFLERAPASVVDKQRRRKGEIQEALGEVRRERLGLEPPDPGLPSAMDAGSTEGV